MAEDADRDTVLARLAREEQLDALDPLRHLNLSPTADSLVPPQPPSVHNQTLELAFPSPHAPRQPHAVPVAIRLAVDASPGCGGIAWPAGEVIPPSRSSSPCARASPSFSRP